MSSENNARDIHPRVDGVIGVAIQHGAAEWRKNADKNTQHIVIRMTIIRYAHSFVMIMPNKGK